MKIKFTYLFLFCFAVFLKAQQNFGLEKGSCVLYKNNIYAYGFRPGALCIYKHNLKLNLIDSTFYIFSDKSKSADYLNIDCDTLHQTLNFCIQKKDKLKATLVRYDSKFKLVSEFKNIEVTKLNPLANYDQQKFIHKNFAYVVKTATDTGGKQYYLSKFEWQKSVEKPFDYKFKWQFNFEKKYIRNVNVFYADTNYVLAYVNIFEGIRKGQWLLKINSATGLLIKGKKISANQNLNYRYSNYCIDTISKNIFILGQLTIGEQLASASPTLFILQFDSLLSLTNQKQVIQKVISADPKIKTPPTYIFQISNIKVKQNFLYEYFIDFYKTYGSEFKYANSSFQSFTIENEEMIINPALLKEYPEIENYYFTQDKKDLNGKLFSDSIKSNDLLFYQPPVFPIKLAFKMSLAGLPIWLLKKNDIKTNTINYSVLQPGKKVYELKAIGNLNKDENPNLIVINWNTYFICNTKNSILHVELGNW